MANPDIAWPLRGRAVAPAPASAPLLPVPRPWVLPLARPAPPPTPLAPNGVAAGHQLLYLAALGRLPLPPALAGSTSAPLVTPPTPTALPQALRRWSGDGWVLLRRGSRGLSGASGFPAYGASQAGGVVRYALRPGSALAPQAQLRLARALGGFDDAEAAAGLLLRPLAALPVRVLGEARLQRGAGRTRLRPAASAITELPTVRLPLGIEGEAYAQAGYVGGKGETPFFDVQATAERSFVRAGPAEVRLGAGAWAGGQEGAARLDLGPRASVRLRLGGTASRLALDWRFRVAGEARPASGPALTFSAGF